MRRRSFLGGAVAATLLGPRALIARTPARPVIGFLNEQSPATLGPLVEAFEAGLAELGYEVGAGLRVEFRSSEKSGPEALRPLAEDLVARGVSLIFISGDRAIAAAQAVTAEIPIVFVTGADPVALGFVDSLNRPGRNITGIVFFAVALEGKRLELLHRLVPSARTIDALIDPQFGNYPRVRPSVEEAAAVLGLDLRFHPAGSPSEIDEAFAGMTRIGSEALLIAGNGYFFTERRRIVGHANRLGLPTVYTQREYPVAGGLLSYGTSLTAAYREAGRYAARILDGGNPAEMPVLRSTEFELVINLRAAEELGLTIPLELRIAATEFLD